MLHYSMLQPEPPWYRDESLWVAISNLVLIVIVVVLAIRNDWLASRRRRAARRLLISARTTKGLRYALKISVNQYQSLRRKFDRRRPLVAPAPAAPPAFVVPPPLDLSRPLGEDPESWFDSGIKTAARDSTLPLRPEDTQTQPIPLLELSRLTQPPRK